MPLTLKNCVTQGLLRDWEPRDCGYPIPSWRETLESTPQAKAWQALHASQNKQPRKIYEKTSFNRTGDKRTGRGSCSAF